MPPFVITAEDLNALHDAPVHALTWRVATPKELSFVLRVRTDADGPFVPLRGRWVRVVFRDPFHARLSAVGNLAHGEEFDGISTELADADAAHLRRMTDAGYPAPPVRLQFSLTSGTEGVVVCERIEVEAADDPTAG